MNKYIFLDFDGVLNTENYLARIRADGKPGWHDYGMLFDPASVANLKRILDAAPDVRIVVGSSWKVRGLVELRLMWAERGLPGTLYDVTQLSSARNCWRPTFLTRTASARSKGSPRERRSAPNCGGMVARISGKSSWMIWQSLKGSYATTQSWLTHRSTSRMPMFRLQLPS